MKTLHIRLKDKHAKLLNKMSREVNDVWNYVNNLSYVHLQRTGKFFSAYDIHQYTTGATKCGMLIGSKSIQMIAAEHVTRRKQFKKAKLNWRVSFGSKKSLGWIPFRLDSISLKDGKFRYGKHLFDFWSCGYDLSKHELHSGNFSQDSRGRWYVNITVNFLDKPLPKDINDTSLELKSVGIDLGLKTLATMSDGMSIERQRYTNNLAKKLAIAQRSGNKKRTRALHAKMKNCRNDYLHKETSKIVKRYDVIFIGNLSIQMLVKNKKMRKSSYDASLSMLKTMLRYKCDYAGVWLQEIDEKYTTQTCSSCGIIPITSPKGRVGLGIREWTCHECGTLHDRDINAAMNILALGHKRLIEGIVDNSTKMSYHPLIHTM